MPGWEQDCEMCNPIAIRSESDKWWDDFERHAINAQPDVDRAKLRKAIDDFRAAQRSLGEAIDAYQASR